MASVLSLTSRSTPTLGGGGGTVFLSLASGVAGLASISDTTAAGTLTAVTDGDYLLGLNAAGTFVRKVLKSSIITTDASLLTSGTLADARLSANVPLKNAANTFSVGGQQINSAAAGSVPLTLKGYSGQTANLTEWQDSAGSVGARVTAAREFSNQYGYGLSEVFGAGATATGNAGTAIGYGATAYGSAVALGREANASGAASIAVGSICTASGPYAFAMGAAATASGTGSMAVGYAASAAGENAMAFGYYASAAANGEFRYYSSGYNPSFVLARDSSTTQRPVAGLTASWADSTDPTRTGQLSLGAYYTGTLQEGMTILATSGAAPTVTVFSRPRVDHGSMPIWDFYAGGTYKGSVGITVYGNDVVLASPANSMVLRQMGGGFYFGDSGANAIMVLTNAGALTVNSTVKTLSTVVATLPSAATAGAGARAFVTDATATTFASAVTGGGANAVPVYSDGAAWYIG